MKYRYLKINGSHIWGVNEITKEMLVAVKNGQYDTIVDTKTNLMFNADENRWVEIMGNE